MYSVNGGQGGQGWELGWAEELNERKEMEELKKRVDDCLNLSDGYECYKDDWQNKAVGIINEYYEEQERYDEIVYDLASDEWEDIVKQQLDTRGWQGLLFFLGKLEPMDDWAYLDGYGNARAVNGSDLVGILKDIKQELGK